MSAFILDNAHINAMLTITAPGYPGDGASYRWQDRSYPFGGRTQEVGQKLVDENRRSVNYRYNEEEEAYTFRPSPYGKRYSRIGLVKACHCYEYQSCECPDWQESEAYAIVKALLARAIRQVEGYEEADTWPIYDDVNEPQGAILLVG